MKRNLIKKTLCLALVVITLLAFTGCDKSTSSPSRAGEDEIPTKEQISLLRSYCDIVDNLNAGVSDNSNRQEYYEELCSMNDVDYWVGTTYANKDFLENYGYLISGIHYNHFSDDHDWDREVVLERFFIVKNVKLDVVATKTDHLGNTSNYQASNTVWNYSPDGTLTSTKGAFFGEPFSIESDILGGYDDEYYEYDDLGRISKITHYRSSNREIEYVRLFTYDESGQLALQTIKNNYTEYPFTYSYDENGRLISISWEHNGLNEVKYTYDTAGKLTKAEKTKYADSDEVRIEHIYIVEYHYDTDGVLVSSTYTEQDWSFKWNYKGKDDNYISLQSQSEHTYSYDEQGRLILETIIPGAKYYMYGSYAGEIYRKPDCAKIEYTTIYGDYYLYNYTE